MIHQTVSTFEGNCCFWTANLASAGFLCPARFEPHTNTQSFTRSAHTTKQETVFQRFQSVAVDFSSISRINSMLSNSIYNFDISWIQTTHTEMLLPSTLRSRDTCSGCSCGHKQQVAGECSEMNSTSMQHRTLQRKKSAYVCTRNLHGTKFSRSHWKWNINRDLDHCDLKPLFSTAWIAHPWGMLIGCQMCQWCQTGVTQSPHVQLECLFCVQHPNLVR